MGNRPALVSQADVARAIRAARGAGLEVVAVVVRPDGFEVRTAPAGNQPAVDDEAAIIERSRKIVL